MTEKEYPEKDRQERVERSKPLKVFLVGDGSYLVESSQNRICYKVRVANGTKVCTCEDFAANAESDPEFICKHILAVHSNGNGHPVLPVEKDKPKLDERFVMTIQGREFVRYSGLLDLAHQRGLATLTVEAVQYPTKDNGNEAICKAVAESHLGDVFIDIGDANPTNVNKVIASHLLRMASTRAKARVLRDMTNIGMTCLEELAEIDDITGGSGGEPEVRTTNKRPPRESRPVVNQAGEKQIQSAQQSVKTGPAEKPESPPEPATQKPTTGVKIFLAQIKAIENLAKRRNITSEELDQIVTKQHGTSLQDLTSADASSLIGFLQKSA